MIGVLAVSVCELPLAFNIGLLLRRLLFILRCRGCNDGTPVWVGIRAGAC